MSLPKSTIRTQPIQPIRAGSRPPAADVPTHLKGAVTRHGRVCIVRIAAISYADRGAVSQVRCLDHEDDSWGHRPRRIIPTRNSPRLPREITGTWVTVYAKHMGNTFDGVPRTLPHCSSGGRERAEGGPEGDRRPLPPPNEPTRRPNPPPGPKRPFRSSQNPQLVKRKPDPPNPRPRAVPARPALR